MQEVLKRSGLLSRLDDEKTDEAADRAENLIELVAAAREFDESLAGEPPPRDPEEVRPPPLARFLEQIALLGEADAETPEGRVALMTLHAAKGLEFEAVFLAGLEDGTLPHERPWMERTPSRARSGHRRGAAALLRRHDPREEAAHPLARAAADRVRRGRAPPGGTWSPHASSPTSRPSSSASLARRSGERTRRAARSSGATQARSPASRTSSWTGRSRPSPRRRGRSLARPAASRPSTTPSTSGRTPAARLPARASGWPTPTFGEGVVVACDAGGRDAKATVRFYTVGEKRVLARFLARAG